jgi:hypothetical protein
MEILKNVILYVESRFILDKISHPSNKNKTMQATKNIVLVKKWSKVTIFEEFFKSY